MRFVVLMALVSVAGALEAQQREPVRPDGSGTRGPYTPGIRHGNVVYASGQLGFSGGTLASGIQAQTRAALENLDRVFQAAGTTIRNSLKCSVFLTSMADFAAMNEAYAGFFPGDPPARTTVAVAALPVPGALVEIDCIAAIP
jgi:2-iminobutanoate/2-iminopropanoate deaminase